MALIVHKNSQAEAEIFETIQGEGIDVGTPAFFIRLQGCSVHCFFCDEKETWVNRDNTSLELNFEEIIEKMEQMNPLLKRVVITGGEPTEQRLGEFIALLLARSYKVSIETAATGEFLGEIFIDHENFFITFSPKEPYSKAVIADESIWSKARELKFVIANQEGADYVINSIIPKLEAADNRCPIFLVPDWYNIEENKERVLELCRQYPNRFRMGWQLHKLLELP